MGVTFQTPLILSPSKDPFGGKVSGIKRLSQKSPLPLGESNGNKQSGHNAPQGTAG